MSTPTTNVERADYCAIACAEIFAGAGEIFASPMTPMATVGARLARLTTEPDLLISDGESKFLGETPAVGKITDLEGWIPFGRVFDTLAGGRRHVVMGANQIDQHGNQNISAFGPLEQPKRQMFGVRGAPGNTINHATSYWVAKHSARVFGETVDVISGIGYDRYESGDPAFRFHHLHRVVTNLGSFDYSGPGGTMHARTLHPGVTPEDVRENTSFEVSGLDSVEPTRTPTEEELYILNTLVDPKGIRFREVPREEDAR